MFGNAALVMWYDVAPSAIADHDQWHTHEHMPERLSVPGFIRGSRWVAEGEGPRYFVMYEVADIDVLSSKAYAERLNNPTPWTARLMPSFRGMARGLCTIEASWGDELASSLFAVRLAAGADVSRRLAAARPLTGITGLHVLRSAAEAAMSEEQRLRGPDAAVDCVLLVNGGDASTVATAGYELAAIAVEARVTASAAYRLDNVLLAT